MMLTASRLTPPAFAELSTATPWLVSPEGSTGSVYETLSPGLFASSMAIAWLRSAIEAVSATAAPSTSKSMYLSE